MADNQNDTVNPVSVEKFLQGVEYPVDKQTLIQHAKDNGADQEVINILERLPDQQYSSPMDVSQVIGNLT